MLRSDYDDGDGAVSKHFDGFAAEDNRGNATPAMRGHDNSVASQLFRVCNTLFVLIWRIRNHARFDRKRMERV
jgi:hypothetical protein